MDRRVETLTWSLEVFLGVLGVNYATSLLDPSLIWFGAIVTCASVMCHTDTSQWYLLPCTTGAATVGKLHPFGIQSTKYIIFMLCGNSRHVWRLIGDSTFCWLLTRELVRIDAVNATLLRSRLRILGKLYSTQRVCITKLCF